MYPIILVRREKCNAANSAVVISVAARPSASICSWKCIHVEVGTAPCHEAAAKRVLTDRRLTELSEV